VAIPFRFALAGCMVAAAIASADDVPLQAAQNPALPRVDAARIWRHVEQLASD
jgi:hypothetical protein